MAFEGESKSEFYSLSGFCLTRQTTRVLYLNVYWDGSHKQTRLCGLAHKQAGVSPSCINIILVVYNVTYSQLPIFWDDFWQTNHG